MALRIFAAYTYRPSAGGIHLRPVSTAGVAELVDAPDSKSGFRKEVRVRFSLPAPLIPTASGRFLFSSTLRNLRERLPCVDRIKSQG